MRSHFTGILPHTRAQDHKESSEAFLLENEHCSVLARPVEVQTASGKSCAFSTDLPQRRLPHLIFIEIVSYSTFEAFVEFFVLLVFIVCHCEVLAAWFRPDFANAVLFQDLPAKSDTGRAQLTCRMTRGYFLCRASSAIEASIPTCEGRWQSRQTEMIWHSFPYRPLVWISISTVISGRGARAAHTCGRKGRRQHEQAADGTTVRSNISTHVPKEPQTSTMAIHAILHCSPHV